MLLERMGHRGKGWRRMDWASAVRRLLPVRGLLGAQHGSGSPAEASLEKYVLELWNQGPTETCVGQADARAVHVRCAAMGAPIEKPSPTAIYVGALAIERELAGLPPETPLRDQGSSPDLAIEAMSRFGIPRDKDWPPGGFDPARVVEEGPDLFTELEKAGEFLLTGWYQIGTTDMPTRMDDVRQAISEGYPVVFGTEVDQEFEDFRGTDPVGAPDTSRLVGGHMMCIVGYRDDGCFRVVNSWGADWGDGGLFWAKPDLLAFEGAGDFSVITVSPAPRGAK
jgi:hypothetical protein